MSVTALFYLEDSRRIHPPSVRACQPKDLKWREWRSAWVRGRQRESALAPPFICSPPGPALCKLGLARSAVCSTWSLHSGPRTFFCSIFVGFSLSCLLATAILDSFSLLYLPNNVYHLFYITVAYFCRFDQIATCYFLSSWECGISSILSFQKALVVQLV